MGSLYRRGDSRFYWLSYLDADNGRRLISSGLEDEGQARKMLAGIERRVRAEREGGHTGPLTVRLYSERWISARRANGVDSASHDEARLRHALPRLGPLLLKDVTAPNIRALMEHLKAGKLAPRTQRHVYGVLRVMFSDALAEGLVSATPCTLRQRRGELPRKRDKDLAWRARAVFARAEVEQLLSDARIPERRRVLYGLLFLGGMRINEVTPRTWDDWDAAAEPLGKLTVGTSYSRTRKAVKEGTKTGVVREVPVHPALASLLASWRLSGWRAEYGRQPQPGDYLVKRDATRMLDCVASLVEFHRDLDLLGLRRRRQHDARRTFISLALGDGASKDLLRRVTHGPPDGDVMDGYTTPPWASLCEQVGKLRIGLLGKNATAVLRQNGSAGMDSGNGVEERGLEGVRPESQQAFTAPDASEVGGLSAEEAAAALNGSSDRSKRSSEPFDYEAHARALGWKLVIGGGR